MCRSKYRTEIPEGEILRRISVTVSTPLPAGVCDCQATNTARHLRVRGYFPEAVPPSVNLPIYS
jgi:hypothetical protein